MGISVVLLVLFAAVAGANGADFATTKAKAEQGDGQAPATSNQGTEIIRGFSRCGKSHGAGTGLLTWWSEAFSCAGAKRRRGLR